MSETTTETTSGADEMWSRKTGVDLSGVEIAVNALCSEQDFWSYDELVEHPEIAGVAIRSALANLNAELAQLGPRRRIDLKRRARRDLHSRIEKVWDAAEVLGNQDPGGVTTHELGRPGSGGA